MPVGPPARAREGMEGCRGPFRGNERGSPAARREAERSGAQGPRQPSIPPNWREAPGWRKRDDRVQEVKTFLGIAVAFAFFGFFILAYVALGVDYYRHKQAPDQPIAFSHKIHVGKVGLQCLFCHETADKAAFAGIPAVEKCMSCHKNVATDRAEIQKLTGYWNRREPMEWNRVHRIRVRKHVYFSHERHITAGVNCTHCHGVVKHMDKIRQVSSLEMGWCVQCHRVNKASTDCLTCHM